MDVGIVDVYTKNDEGKTTRKQFEVDFVVNQGSQRYYIQVAYDMTSEAVSYTHLTLPTNSRV